MLLQEFDIETRDKQGVENLAIDQLTQPENQRLEKLEEREINDTFPEERLCKITGSEAPWFSDYANYLVGGVVPSALTWKHCKKFFSDVRHYFWDNLFLFKVCVD